MRVDAAADPVHQRWMRRALALAEAARGETGPNPFVGAVVVGDGGEEVGAGSTGPVGTAHAEPRALAVAGDRATGATLYVTLEPCAHHGRTPPCTDAVLAAGIRRVVVGMRDPNPVAGGGIDVLRAAGIEVVEGVLAHRVATQLAVFVTTVRHRRPYVTLKLAQTSDGVTDPALLSSRWITGPVARARVHDLRAGVAGILVGSTTALVDDPALTVRAAPPGPVPPRAIVVDRRGRLPTDHRVVRDGTIVVTSAHAPTRWCAGLRAAGVDVVAVDSLAGGLEALLARDVVSVLAEPGPTLAQALLADEVVDRLLVHVASSSVADPGGVDWAVPTTGLAAVARRRLGPDVEWEFRPRPAPTPWAPPHM